MSLAPRPPKVDRHVLDRPVWSALTTHRAALAIGDERARRLAHAVGLFAAAADASPAALAALAGLAAPGDTIGTVERLGWPDPPNLRRVDTARCVQMVLDRPLAGGSPAIGAALDEKDAPAMLDLASRTRPGPFRSATHRFGGFVGVKVDGRLVAMAGTRLAAPGFVEVSGVCTDPEHRGRGLARALSAEVAAAILATGSRPFLHAYAGHRATIALYEALGFRVRAELDYAQFTRG